MSAPGSRRGICDKIPGAEKYDSSTTSLQMGSNQGANQSGQIFGLKRQIFDPKYSTTAGEREDDQNGAGIPCNYIPDYQDEGYQGYQEEEQVYQDDGTDY